VVHNNYRRSLSSEFLWTRRTWWLYWLRRQLVFCCLSGNGMENVIRFSKNDCVERFAGSCSTVTSLVANWRITKISAYENQRAYIWNERRQCRCVMLVCVCVRVMSLRGGEVVAGERRTIAYRRRRRRRRRRARAHSMAVGVRGGKTVIATLPCATGRREATLHGRRQCGNVAAVSFRVLIIFLSHGRSLGAKRNVIHKYL